MGKEKLILLVFALVMSVTGVCHAGYTLLSTTYWAKGTIGDSVVYEYTSATGPAEGGYSEENGLNNFQSWTGPFRCNSEIYFPDEPEEAVANKYFKAAASCTITFQPLGDEIEIYSEGAIWESFGESDFVGGWMYLTDTTSGNIIYSFGASEMIGGGLYSIRTDHIYELYMYYETSGILPVYYNGGYIAADFTVIPEPASLILLAICSLKLARKRK